MVTLEYMPPASGEPLEEMSLYPGAHLTGFTTVYKFYHHPDGVRHRVSQVRANVGRTLSLEEANQKGKE